MVRIVSIFPVRKDIPVSQNKELNMLQGILARKVQLGDFADSVSYSTGGGNQVTTFYCQIVGTSQASAVWAAKRVSIVGSKTTTRWAKKPGLSGAPAYFCFAANNEASADGYFGD
jgi:hypothetical protein